METTKKVRLAALALAAVAGAGCSESTSLQPEDLQGTWSASAYVYTGTGAITGTVDLVQRDGATFTLAVAATGEAETVFDDGVGGTSSDSGTMDFSQTTLTLAGRVFMADRSGDDLTLFYEEDEFDLDGNGSKDPASLTIRLRRTSS